MATQHEKIGNVFQIDFEAKRKAWNLREFILTHGIPRSSSVVNPNVVTSVLRLANDNALVREVTHG